MAESERALIIGKKERKKILRFRVMYMTLCSGLCGRNLRTQVLPSRRSRAGGLCRSLTTNPGTTIGEEKDFLAFVAKIYLFIYFITIIIYLSIHPSIYTLHRTPWTFTPKPIVYSSFPPFFSPSL
jgi:hypothetical protein